MQRRAAEQRDEADEARDSQDGAVFAAYLGVRRSFGEGARGSEVTEWLVVKWHAGLARRRG